MFKNDWMSNKKNLLITGGAGFIGSHLVIHLVKKYSNYRIINVDSLTDASNLKNLAEIQNSQNYIFEKIDIRDKNAISQILIKYEIDNINICMVCHHWLCYSIK